MRNAGVDEVQAGIKIAKRNINNLTYADDTLMAESKEELKSLLMKVKEESEKVGLKLNIHESSVEAFRRDVASEKAVELIVLCVLLLLLLSRFSRVRLCATP